MKNNYLVLLMLCFTLLCGTKTYSQNYTLDEHKTFLNKTQNLTTNDVLVRFDVSDQYYSNRQTQTQPDNYKFFNDVKLKLNLTTDEIELLKKNQFMVTERLSYGSLENALLGIYEKDLPMMITTDAVLYVLHKSYDAILCDLEHSSLMPNLTLALNKLRTDFPKLKAKYENSNPELVRSLEDVDLYITVAQSLLTNTLISPDMAQQAEVYAVLWAIQSENFSEMPLFTYTPRKIDFSQFTVRGHYADNEEYPELSNYFKCMMWLGRIDFILSGGNTKDSRRMCVSAYMLNELNNISGANEILEGNNKAIEFLVGESDNLAPVEFTSVCQSLEINDASQLLDTIQLKKLQTKLLSDEKYGQKILSSLLETNPYSSEPTPLPVSFLLMGQRFIVDSYIFSNLVYDRIIYEDKKMMRMMPNPLDAMFVLGNNNALPLLKDELDTYKYASQITTLRHLVDQYDETFWNKSLYNVWLNSIRTLHQPVNPVNLPYFMQTTAWQQEKLNTQLASWAQLRHDNLLYAKQSYTGMVGCSYPHSYVEPYPEFYRSIAQYSKEASSFFSTLGDLNKIRNIREYFVNLEMIMNKFEVLATKELNREQFSKDEEDFLKSMIGKPGECGGTVGWYYSLLYGTQNNKLDIADVHTQPTDEFGNMIGKVLHVGTGLFNLGVFFAPSPSDNFTPMAFVGPVQSYYEYPTLGFDRLTDQRWTSMLSLKTQPPRPDWVNIYLADREGKVLSQGRELQGKTYTGVEKFRVQDEQHNSIVAYPNPFTNQIGIAVQTTSKPSSIKIYNIVGQVVKTFDIETTGETLELVWNGESDSGKRVDKGIYLFVAVIGDSTQTVKIVMQ